MVEKVSRFRIICLLFSYVCVQVDSGVLGSDKTLQDMQRTMQELYAQAFRALSQ